MLINWNYIYKNNNNNNKNIVKYRLNLKSLKKLFIENNNFQKKESVKNQTKLNNKIY